MPPVATALQASDVARLRLVNVRLARRLKKYSGDAISPSQLSALTTLRRHGPLRVGQLAEREQISRSSTPRLGGRLEALGLVSRTPDAEDGRSAWIGLTDKGADLLAESSRRADVYLSSQVARLEPADHQVLLDALPVLERLLDHRP